MRAGVHLFQAKGYHATGINEVLERAKAPKGSFYHHFPGGKEALAIAAIQWIEAETTAFLDKTAEDSAAAMVMGLARYAAQGVKYYKMKIHEPDALANRKRVELVKKALAIREALRPWMNVFYDDAGSIGRRYARQDEAGTPFCVTVDFDTLGEKPELLDTVTLRYRDDGKQERLPIAQLKEWLLERIR